MSTVLFVFPADRGHFQLSIPLALGLLQREVVTNVEYFTHEQAKEWVSSHSAPGGHMYVGGSLGVFPKAFVGLYTELASSGGSFEEGLHRVSSSLFEEAKKRRITVPEFNLQFGGLQPSKTDRDALRKRINDEDVLGVVAEGTWAAFVREWEREKPILIVNPSLYGPLKLRACVKQFTRAGRKQQAGESCCSSVDFPRHTLQSVSDLCKTIGIGLDPHLANPTYYTLASPLRRKLQRHIPMDISKFIGAILPHKPRRLQCNERGVGPLFQFLNQPPSVVVLEARVEGSDPVAPPEQVIPRLSEFGADTGIGSP